MKNMDAFINVFGDITVLQVLEFFLAVWFCWVVYNNVKKYLIEMHEKEEKRDSELKEALEAARKYPEYRKQSIAVQHELEERMSSLGKILDECMKKLLDMEDADKRRTRNQLRDRLLQSYRYYTNPEKNPSMSWTRMESEAFWELFQDYEEADGDGYMHSVVMPDMQRLTVVEVGTHLEHL